MSDKSNPLRNLPAVDEVVRWDRLSEIVESIPQPSVVEWIREAIDDCRSKIQAGDQIDPEAEIVRSVSRRYRHDRGGSLQKVINATGVVLHTNLGRAPMADCVVQRMTEVARYANVELNLQQGKRSRRGDRACRLLAKMAGSDDALIVNNCASATLLVLQSVAKEREVIVSRGQLVEIGGGFRLPDVFRASGAELIEVGTTNRTYLHDYQSAIGDKTGAIIRVHRSNFHQSGFVTEPSIDQLMTIDRPAGVALVDDLGSGAMIDFSDIGLDEPTVMGSVASGADLTLFSGDKLFGGPQCGIVVGKQSWIDQLRRSPMMRAVRVDKLTLAAVEATAEIYLRGEAKERVPVLEMLYRDIETIRDASEALVDQIGELQSYRVGAIPCEAQVGGGSIPGSSLASYAVQIKGQSTERLAERLRQGSPAIQTRVVHDAVLLDMRTVDLEEIGLLATLVRDAVSSMNVDRA